MIVALEGCDGVGKSTHADHLSRALRQAGVYSLPWHHPPPPDRCRTPYSRALWYAAKRAEFIENEYRPASHAEPLSVWVVDRWWQSTAVHAACSPAFPYHEAARHLCSAEAEALPQDVLTILLVAPLAEIEHRLQERGESTAGVRAQHDEYWRLAGYHGWIAAATTPPREQVTARLVGIVRGMLAAAVPQGVCPAPTEGL